MATEEELLILKRELALEKRLRALQKENALEFFRPHPKQQDFFAAAGNKYRYARTGNRFGKSEMGDAEDVAFALGYRPWIPEGNPLRTLGIPSTPTKGLIITTDWDKSTEVFTEMEGSKTGKLIRYIPKSAFLGFTRNHSGAVDHIQVKHGSGGTSVIHLDTVMSYKQNPLGQESSAWDWIHVDEPIPEGMWKAAARGLVDTHGSAWFTCTPISEPWIDAAFIPDLSDQSQADLGIIASEHSRWMMTGSMDDNPHNTPEAIADYMSWLTDEEKEARRTGIPLAYSGLVYKEFRWQDHVSRECPVGWRSWAEPPADHTLRFAVDYHPRKPHHVLFIATSPTERQYVYAEIFLSCLMDELFAEIKKVLGGREPTVPGQIDPLADTEDRVTGVSAMDRLMQLGLPLVPATKDPSNGILAVKKLLKSRERLGQTTVVVNPACSRFLYEISRGFQWDKDTNKPVKKDDDAMENFYRLTLKGLDYVEPAQSDDYAPIPVRDIPLSMDYLSLDADPEAERRAEKNRLYEARYQR